MRTQKHSFAYEHLCGYCAREKQMSYEILKLIHLLSMLLLLGIGSGLAFYKYMTDKKGSLEAIVHINKEVVLANWLFPTPLAIL